MIGNTISNYKILKKLGEGGMGVVYLAEDLTLERNVAIKFLPQQLIKDEQIIERFQREAKAAAVLNHPNIVTIYEVKVFDDQAFIVMEYIDGMSLRELIINESPLERERVIDLLSQIAEGLSKAHQAGIIHRDIKPENIMIHGDGRAKILDFGLAKLKGVSRLTKDTSTLGTIQYMSPEQIQGADADERSDIWSLGVVCYEMLTNILPFDAEYEQAISYIILNEKQISMSSIRDGIPEELERIINQTLSKSPEDRYQRSDELLQELSKYREKRSLASKSEPKNVSKNRWRKFISKSVIITSIIITISLIYVFGVSESKSHMPIQIAVVDFVNETDMQELNGLSGMLTTALEQSSRLSIVTRSRMFDTLKKLGKDDIQFINESVAREIAQHSKINLLALASIKKFDEVYNIDLKIIDVIDDKYLFTASVKDKGIAKIPSLIDELSEKTRLGLEEKEEAIRLSSEPVAQMTTPNLEAYQHYFKGQEYIDRGKFKDAQTQFRKAIQIDSAFGLAYYRLAYALDWESEETEAEEQLKKAFKYIENIPEKEQYLVQAVKQMIDNGWGKGALSILQKMERIYPNDKEMLYNIGDLFYHMGEYDKSEVYLKRVLEIDPKSARAMEHLVFLYTDTDSLSAALSLLRKMEHSDPNDEQILYLIGDILYEMGDLEQSEQYLLTVLEINPRLIKTYNRLFDIYEDTNRLEETEQIVKKYPIALEEAMNIRIASAYVQNEKTDILLNLLLKKRQLNPDKEYKYIIPICYLYFAKNDNTTALKLLIEEIDVKKRIKDVEEILRELNRIENFNSQKILAAKILDYVPDNFISLLSLGHLFARNDEYEKSVAYLEKALQVATRKEEKFVQRYLKHIKHKLVTY